jgi:regulatory protein
MPTITDIKRQKQSSDSRFSVYVDGEYSFALSDLALSTSGLRVGQALSAAELDEYRGAAEQSKVYNLALRYLSFRMRSKREMSDYLRRQECIPEQIEVVMRRLEAEGLLNDELFSVSWVATRQSLRPRSKWRLEQELIAKGIAHDDMASALSEIDSDTELEQLVQLAERKQRLPQYRDPAKLMSYLGRQGYRYDLIKKALERLNAGDLVGNDEPVG